MTATAGTIEKSQKQLKTATKLAIIRVWIRGFHVTQVSSIITQVKNKNAYHSIN